MQRDDIRLRIVLVINDSIYNAQPTPFGFLYSDMSFTGLPVQL